MIYLYSGTPGSGKSLHQADNILYRLRLGKPVLANFDINLKFACGKKDPRKMGEFYYIDNAILNPDILVKYSRLYFKNHKFKEGAIQLYIDECQLLFNARDWQTKGRKEWLSFFTQHRKLGYDIFLVAQFDKMIDKQVRSLIEYEVIHRKVKNFGKFGFVLNAAAGGNLFVAVTVWYPLKEQIEHRFFKGRKKLFQLYDTYNTFNTEDKMYVS